MKVLMRDGLHPGFCFLITLLLVVNAGDAARGQGFPGHWKARWIWTSGETHRSFHYFLMARHDFNISGTPRSAKLDITAFDRYILYVNGEYLGRGPARSDARWKSYDSYEVASHLRVGKNTIAVLAYHYGRHNGYTRDAQTGLFAQLEVSNADGRRQILGTNSDWRVRHALSWSRDVDPAAYTGVGFTEVYDANLDPPNWQAPDFDDSQWEHAYVTPEAVSASSYLEPRQTPLMRETEVLPVRVVKVGEVLEMSRMFTEAQVPERLTAEPLFPLQYATVRNPEALMGTNGQVVQFQSAPFRPGDPPEKGIRSPYIILDFGRQVFGFPRVKLNGAAQGIVEMTYSTTLMGGRVFGVIGGPRYGDRYIMRAGQQTWQVFEYKQFRFLQIVFRNVEQPVSVDSISVVAYEYPAERKGQFECSDPTLTKLWKADVDTTYLSMEDALVCDAQRERRVWAGDGAHGLFGVWAGFGDVAISDWYFKLIARGRMADGMLRMYYPGSDIPQDYESEGLDDQLVSETPLNIPQESLVYALTIGDFFQYFGKRELLEDLYPTVVNLLDWCQRHTDGTGLLYGLPNWNWVDWARTDIRGANFETNAIYYQILVNMSDIARFTGKAADAARWKSQAEKVKVSLRSLFWNPQRKIYVDSVFEGRQSTTATEVAGGMALRYGIATADQVPGIVRQIADPHVDLVRASPLFFNDVIEGLMQAGAVEEALALMRDRYAPMMDFTDSPTIWESFVPYVRIVRGVRQGERFGYTGTLPSFVHTGGVGSAWTMSRYVLGINPVGPGFQKCRIEPHTGQLEWARGALPSVKGDIKVEWKKDKQRFTFDTTLPAGLETKLVFERDASKNLRLTHNGQEFEIRAGTKSARGFQLLQKQIVVRVTGGSHHLELTAN